MSRQPATLDQPAAAPITRRSKFTPRTVGNLDHQIIDLLFTLMESFKGHFVNALAAFDLPLTQGHLLMSLDEPIAMSDMAHTMGFDASHITSIVDRLEERTLVERRPDPVDRRVKRIAITAEGIALREQIRTALFETLPPLSRLSDAQRRQLHGLLTIAAEG